MTMQIPRSTSNFARFDWTGLCSLFSPVFVDCLSSRKDVLSSIIWSRETSDYLLAD